MGYQKSLRIDVFDVNVNYLGVIDYVDDLTFERMWYEIGEFTIKLNINANPTYAALLAPNNIIMIDQDPYKSGIVTKITDEVGENNDGKGSQWRTAHGYELKEIFQWRIVSNFNYTTSDNGNLWHYSGPAESAMKALVNDQCGPNSASFGDGGKLFSRLSIATDHGRGPNYVVNERGSSLYSVVYSCASACLLGWYCYLDPVNKRIVMDCALGLDRCSDQSANPWAVFSVGNDTLKDASIDDSLEDDFANILYVQGQTSTYMAFVGGSEGGSEPTDMLRREKFIDSTSTSATATESEMAQLVTIGEADLAKYTQTLTLDGDVVPYSQLGYRTQYDIGDTVMVQTGIASYSVQILGAQEEWKKGEYTLSMSWGKPTANITRQLFQQNNIAKGTAYTAVNGVNAAAEALASADAAAKAWEQATAPTIGSARPYALNGDTWFNTANGQSYTAVSGAWVSTTTSNNTMLLDCGVADTTLDEDAATLDCGTFTAGVDSAATLRTNLDCGSTS